MASEFFSSFEVFSEESLSDFDWVSQQLKPLTNKKSDHNFGWLNRWRQNSFITLKSFQKKV